MELVLGKWDEALTAILFSSYGLTAIFQQPRAQATTPYFFAILFNIEFILTGIFVIIGILVNNYNLQLLGYMLYCTGLFTIGLLILIIPHSYVGLICLAFCLLGISRIRMLLRDRKIQRHLRELIQITKPKDS